MTFNCEIFIQKRSFECNLDFDTKCETLGQFFNFCTKSVLNSFEIIANYKL